MGCSISRIDQLPAVSLCHDRCKFLEEALYQSYALADAHVAYMHSLKSLGPALHRFFDEALINNQSDSQSNGDSAAVTKLSKPSSPDIFCPSSSTNSETSHIDFRSDSEDEEFKDNKDLDSLHRVHKSQFNPFSYDHLDDNEYDYPAWKTPPPPAPSSSAWDFLNFFETYERYELPTKDKEFVNGIRLEGKCGKNGEEDRREAEKGNNVKQKKEAKVAEEKKVEYVKEESKESKDLGHQAKIQSVLEVMKGAEVLFDKAAESGNEVLKIFDAGKFRYYYKNSVYQGVSSKMLHTVTPSFSEKNGSVHGDFDEDLGIISVNLSSTLRKLCLWEKKLYHEVKAEEKLRLILAKNCGQMNILGEKGADANKVNSTQPLLRMLSTKITVAIQVIDKISITISKLRDEELWPLISDLIEKLLDMWKVMLECHRCQSQAVVETRSLDAVASNVKFSDACLEAAIQLKIELQNWNLSFSNWINAQRGYVRALNGWLLRCLPSELEETLDDVPPFSPGRTGAPPVFAFCNQWSLAIDRVSEMEVIYAMNGLFDSVNQFLERHHVYLQQRLTTDKDMVKKMKILEREGQRLQKVIQARGKTFQAGRAVHRSEMTDNSSLQFGLRQIFVAIEQFSADTMHGYEELHVHIEHSRLGQENPAAP
ncbi:protein ALTERED PHOSPHATE STARVATION RESPONSE 1-like [Populus nigra]|uniref:protein ALTERED PHOSPHATE STARVATION RESPONSE 1-like n=1 Tax=Populus nigra TaxID=3691 RepID=UPI002B276676|nr:protein ALTERED PHOSPHATE STARVATION RESPONSE 1-like [Populus nigra]